MSVSLGKYIQLGSYEHGPVKGSPEHSGTDLSAVPFRLAEAVGGGGKKMTGFHGNACVSELSVVPFRFPPAPSHAFPPIIHQHWDTSGPATPDAGHA